MNAGRGRRNSDQSRDTDLASAALYDSHDRLARLETSVAGIGSTLDKFIESTDNRFRSIEESVDREGMSWFDVLSAGISHSDFFASRVDSYSKGTISFENIFDGEDDDRAMAAE
jgi:hypothetical protein